MALTATLWQKSSRVCSVHLMLLFELAHRSMTTPRHTTYNTPYKVRWATRQQKNKPNFIRVLVWYSKFCFLLSLTHFCSSDVQPFRPTALVERLRAWQAATLTFFGPNWPELQDTRPPITLPVSVLQNICPLLSRHLDPNFSFLFKCNLFWPTKKKVTLCYVD